MKLLILYRPNSEHSTLVETFAHDFQRQYNVAGKLDLVSINTRDGAATANLYDVMSYPAILALGDDGAILNVWQGENMPLMDEVAGYVYA